MAEENPLIEFNRPYMEIIWRRVPKTLKGDVEYIVYEAHDLPALYESGLVDTQRYSLEQWERAFENCKGEDGCFWVSYEKMISLGQYRFSKIVAEPFDPLRVRTGEYTIEQLWRLFEKAVIPSCSLPPEKIKELFNKLFRKKLSVDEALREELEALKEAGEETEDLLEQAVHFKKHKSGEVYIEVTAEELTGLKELIDAYPSPRRKLELGVQRLRQEKLDAMAQRAKENQKSTFEEGRDFRKTTQEDLLKMLVKTQTKAAGGREPLDEELDLKSLQKKGGLRKKV